ncbi:hypothetical protein QOT17_019862 [Balamuthia mandrillaris]
MEGEEEKCNERPATEEVEEEEELEEEEEGEEGVPALLSGEVTEELLQEAERRTRDGHALMSNGEYEAAQEAFSKALEIRVAKYGEVALEIAPDYYNYGLALVQGAKREQRDFLSRALIRRLQDKDSTEELDAEEEESDRNALEETLQLVWEILETARVIYSKSEAHKVELAQVHKLLGVFSQDTGNSDDALKEYGTAEELLREALPSHDLRIAELLEVRGTLHSDLEQHDEAIQQYREAMKVIQLALDNATAGTSQEQRSGEKDKGKETEASKGDQPQKVTQLQEKLASLAEKIKALEDEKEAKPTEEQKKLREALGEVCHQLAAEPYDTSASSSPTTTASPSASSSSSSQPVVHNLGVFGRSSKSKTSARNSTTTINAATNASSTTKRKREDDEEDRAEKEEGGEETQNNNAQRKKEENDEQEGDTRKRARVG